jgi:hypothetical protein
MRPTATRWNLWFAVWVFAGCATTRPADETAKSTGDTAAAKANPPPPPAGLEKVREELQFAPWEVALSGVRGETGPTEMVRARNLVNRPVTISGVKVVGDAANLFSVKGAPAFPVVIPAGGSLAVEVELGPPADANAGLQRGVLRFQTGDSSDEGPSADLAALVLSGRDASAEPSLQQIVDALGFAIDVGGKTLQLPEANEARGDEAIGAALFQRARPTPVALNPVARFSPDGAVAYGYYLPGQSLRNVDTRQLGVMVAGQAGTLNPEVEAGAETNFDPGEARFGVWMSSPDVVVGGVSQRAFTEARRNRGDRRSLARVYPLRTRGGAPVPDTFLVAFGEATRADYQDAVFVLSNVKLVGR